MNMSLKERILHFSGIETRLSKTLEETLKQFRDGQVLIIKKEKDGSNIFCGKIERVYLSDIKQKNITIICSQLYKRIPASDLKPAGWQEIDVPKYGISFDFDWYRMPKKTTNKHPVQKIKFASKANDRCWLCPPSDPAHLQLFRAMLLLMFCNEEVGKEKILEKMARNVRLHLLK